MKTKANAVLTILYRLLVSVITIRYIVCMWKLWNKIRNKRQSEKPDIETIAEEQFKKHQAVFESLKAYDEGKKDISTANVREHLRHLRHTR